MTEILYIYIAILCVLLFYAYRQLRKGSRTSSGILAFFAMLMVFFIWTYWDDTRSLGNTEKAMYAIVPSPTDFKNVSSQLDARGIQSDIVHRDKKGNIILVHPDPRYILAFKSCSIYRNWSDSAYVRLLTGLKDFECCK